MTVWEIISPYLSAIVLIGGVVAVIAKWIAPALKLADNVKRLGERVERLEEHDKNDKETFKEIDRFQKAQVKATLSMVNHMIDGNGIEALRRSRDELQDLILH
jgi:uncharacterized protein YutE (UPF0331/DUF86 family)